MQVAAERGAIDTLMVTDGLFRAADVKTRATYVELVDAVRAGGGKVVLFSSLHASGEQLTQASLGRATVQFVYGGIVCLCLCLCICPCLCLYLSLCLCLRACGRAYGNGWGLRALRG